MTAVRHTLQVGLLVLGLSGAAALGHQVLWTRRLTDLVGANAESCTRVFECFFLGMSLGSAVVARVAPKLRHPWRTTGYIEFGIAVLCLPAAFLPFWTDWIWPALGPEKLVAWQGQVIRLVLSLLVALPPAFLIGMTLPLVTEAIDESGENSAHHRIWLYAAYTLGGGLGLAIVVGLALSLVGPQASMLLMAGINALAAAICLSYDARGRQPICASVQTPAKYYTENESRLFHLSPLLALFSGAGILALETLGLQLLNLKLPLAFYTPAAVLSCVVVWLGCSAAIVPRWIRWFGGTVNLLPFSMAGAGFMAAACPVIFLTLTAGHSGIIVHGSGISRSLLWLVCVTCVSLGPAMFLAGVVFPILLGGPNLSDRDSKGCSIGQLLAINGLGGILGAEVVIRVLLPRVGVHLALGIVGLCYALLALGLIPVIHRKGHRQLTFLLALVTGTGCLLVTTLRKLPIFLRSATFHVVEVRSGVEGSLAVVERADLGRAMFLDNLYLLGSSKAVPDLERQAHLPLLLHASPKRVGFIGLGTGITAGGTLRHEAVESITIVELSTLVASAAARQFRDFNHGICEHPKAKVFIEDAGPYFMASRVRFDVIVGDLFTPWRPGEARLCSQEHFQSVKEALLPGGVFCQWLQMSQLTEHDFKTIAATFQKVFGRFFLFRNHFRTGSAPLALVGFRQGTLDWETVGQRCLAERQYGRLRDPICRYPQGLALLYLGTHQSEGGSEKHLNTQANLQVELRAGRHILTRTPNDYFNGNSDRWLDFLQKQVRAIESSPEMPDSLRGFPKAGLLATRWEIASEQQDPSASSLQKMLLAEIPSPVLNDLDADWSFWAGQRLINDSILPDGALLR